MKKDIYPQGSDEQPDLDEMITEVASYCDEVVLTPYLREGENVIAALVWYYGNEGHSHVGSGQGAFLFESRMGDELIISDSSWKVSRHTGYQPSSRVNVHAQDGKAPPSSARRAISRGTSSGGGRSPNGRCGTA